MTPSERMKQRSDEDSAPTPVLRVWDALQLVANAQCQVTTRGSYARAGVC